MPKMRSRSRKPPRDFKMLLAEFDRLADRVAELEDVLIRQAQAHVEIAQHAAIMRLGRARRDAPPVKATGMDTPIEPMN